MSEVSYATARKIKVIENRLGSQWRQIHPDKSVDALYNELMGDDRKNLFCKVNATTKDRLDEMVLYYDVKMSEYIEELIEREYIEYNSNRSRLANEVAKDFSGS